MHVNYFLHYVFLVWFKFYLILKKYHIPICLLESTKGCFYDN